MTPEAPRPEAHAPPRPGPGSAPAGDPQAVPAAAGSPAAGPPAAGPPAARPGAAGPGAAGPERPSAGPRRVFLGWERPALAAAADWLAREAPAGARGAMLDLQGWRVVLPGARAGRRLLELLLEEAEARGLALAPPELLTVGSLPERLHPPTRPAPHPQVEAAAWRTALAAMSPADRALLLPGSRPGGNPGSSGSTGSTGSTGRPGSLEAPGDPAAAEAVLVALAPLVAGLHAQLGAEGIDFDAVVRRCRGAGDRLLFNDEARWGALARAQARFRALLEAEGLEDRESARARAMARSVRPAAWPTDATVDFPTPPPAASSAAASSAAAGLAAPDGPPLVLVGVVDPPGVVRTLLGAYPGPVTALIHAPEEIRDHFDALGAVEPDRWDARPLRIPEQNLEVVNRPDEQARALVTFMQGLGGRRAPEEVTVGAPDAELMPMLRAALGEAGVPNRSAEGRVLRRSAPWRLLDAVGRLLEGWDRDALADLLRHPAFVRALPARVKTDLGGVDPVTVADRYQAEHLQAVADGFVAGKGPWLARFRILRDGVATLLRDAGFVGEGQRPAEPRSLRAWAEPVRTLVIALYPGREVDREAPHDREFAAFLQALRGVLEGFEALPPTLDATPVSAPRALRTVLEAIGDEAVPPPADEGAVELLGWLELHLDDAPELVITGVNEPHLPESVTAHPFLPHALRSLLGLPDNRRRSARDRYLLEAILASRPRTRLVAGRRDADGNPLRLSRLLLAGPPAEVAERVLRLLGEAEATEPAAADPGAARERSVSPAVPAGTAPPTPGAVPPAAFRLPPEPVLRAPLPPDRIAVTTFRAVLADPYRYALERVLGLEAVTDEARELDPRAFGTLAHEVVERWAKEEVARGGQARGPGGGTPAELEAQAATIASALEGHLEAAFRDRFGLRPLPALHLQREQLRLRLRALAWLEARRRSEGWEIRHVEAGPPRDALGVPFEVDGEVVHLFGRIDRIDHHPATGRWQLLDLKTSEAARTPDAVHRKGRQGAKVWVDLQLPLYRHLAVGIGLLSPDDLTGGRVETGYLLLPDGVEEVEVALASWTAEELAEADEAAREVVRTLRANRFTWDPATSALRDDDPLAPVVGRGVLPGGDDDGETDAES